MNPNLLNPKNSNHAAAAKLLLQMQVLKGDKGDKGDDGYTPIKGTDYFTNSEIEAIINYIQGNVKNGIDGAEGRKGKDGSTPIQGFDYYTKEDQDKLIASILKLIKPAKDGITPDSKKIAEDVIKQISIPDTSKHITQEQLIDFLRRGGFRGGGSGGSVSPLTTKGDLYTRNTTADTRLPVGTDGQVLSADSAQATGLRWIALTGGGDMVLAASQIVSGLKTFLDTTFGIRNVANTFTGLFTTAITAARTWTFPDKSGTVAMTSDITGTNSGTNTGDQLITLTGGVTGSGTGSFATTVVTNANLTGGVTSVGNAATVITNANLTGDVTSVGNATTITNAPVIAKVLTGYVSGAGTVAATDSILAAIQKLNGNDALKETSSNKDATGGYAGLTLFKINFKNAANTFTNFLTNATTAARTYTFPDKDITVAGLVDITGTNSGTNTGDQTIILTGHVTGSGTGSFATSTASKMILQGTTDGTTSAAQFLGALATGVVKNTTTTGVLSIAINSDLPAMSATVGGAVPTPPNNTTTFLRGDGTFATPSGGSGTTWTEVTGTSQAAAVSNGYVTNNVALVTVTLPSTATVGQIIYLQGSGAGGWKLAQNASQTIVWDAGAVAGTNITTAGITGSISSSDRYDSLEVQCITTNTGWVVRNSKGNLIIT